MMKITDIVLTNKKKFIEHLKENDMTYWQHFNFAVHYGLICLFASIFLVVHAALPCFFQTIGSDLVKKLAKKFDRK